MEVASVRRQQDVIAVGRCFWLTGPFKCWAVQEKILSGCFSDAWREEIWLCSTCLVALDPDPDPNLLWPEQSLRDRVLLLHAASPHSWQLLMDAALAQRQDGWKGQACWALPCLLLAILVQEKPLLNVLNRNLSKFDNFKWKHRHGVLVLKNITYSMSEWQLFATFWALPFCSIQKSKELILCHFCIYFGRDVSRRTGAVSEETKLSLKDLCILTTREEKPIL